MTVTINSKLPEFTAKAYHANTFIDVSSNDFSGKWVVFFFYPADFTFVCPTELADVAEKYPQLQSMGVEVVSVSTDTHFTHKAWHDASDTIKTITFPMLADPTARISRAFGVYNEEDGIARRGTFIVAPDGSIKSIEVTDNGIGRNADELLRKVQAAQYIAKHPKEVCPAKWNPGESTLEPSLDLVGKL
ncbi:peroxiredoxin [bacterium]|nr:peroxiredoxin [bacterium]